MNPKLKHVPDDFVVSENCVLHFGKDADDKAVHYLILRKAGYSTFEAVTAMASFFNISQSRIHYAGLKDENAVTSQHISIDCILALERLKERRLSAGSEIQSRMNRVRSRQPISRRALARAFCRG